MQEVPAKTCPSSQELTQAVAVLLQYTDVRAVSSPQGPISAAYRCLLDSIDFDPRESICLLLQKVYPQNSRVRALRLLNAIALKCLEEHRRTPSPKQAPGCSTYSRIVGVLQAVVEAEGPQADSKQQLAAVLALQEVLLVLEQCTQSDSDRGTLALSLPDFELQFVDLQCYVPLIRPLVRLMHDKSSIAAGKRQPTKLTTEANDALCLLLYLMALRGVVSESITDETEQAATVFWDLAQPLEQYLRLLHEWNTVHRELFAAAARSLSQRFLKIKDFKNKADYQAYLNPRDTVSQKSSQYVVCHFWCTFCPQLMEASKCNVELRGQTATAVRRTQNVQDAMTARDGAVVQLVRTLSHIDAPADGGQQQETQNEVTYMAVVSVCLTLGRMGKRLRKFLDTNATLVQSLCDTLMQRVFQYRDEAIQALAAQIMTVVMTTGHTWDGGGDCFLQMLEERDGATTAAVSLVAQYAARHPQTMLPQIFARLKSESRIVRSNALDVIEGVFRVARADAGGNGMIAAAQGPGPGPAQAGGQEQGQGQGQGQDAPPPSSTVAAELLQSHPTLMRTLAALLLDRLADSELALRTQSAGLFQYFAPALVVPPLVAALWHPDTRRRSAAHDALRHVLSGNTMDLAHVLSLLDTLNENSAAAVPQVPITPADIGRLVTPAPAADPDKHLQDKVDMAFRYVTQWAEHVPQQRWPTLISQCLEAVVGDPTHLHKVRLVAVLAPHFADFRPLVFTRICKHLEEVAVSPPDEPPEGAVFRRLAPLLLLRAVPAGLYTSGGASDDDVEPLLLRLQTRLWDGAFAAEELPDVRKLCMELCARFSAAWLCAQLLPSLRDALRTETLDADALFRAKLCVFGICNALNVHASEDPFPAFCQEYTALLLDECLVKFDFEDTEAEKLCRGCIECLAQTIVVYDLPAAPCSAGAFCCVAQLLTRLLSDDDSADPYIVAAFQAAVKMCGDRTDRVAALAERVVEPLVRRANRSAVAKAWGLATACLHTLFLLVYSLKGAVHPHVPALGDMARTCLGHGEGPVRLGGLKLLGALMAARDDLFTFFSPEYLRDCARRIHGIAAMDSDPQARQLAAGLAPVFALDGIGSAGFV